MKNISQIIELRNHLAPLRNNNRIALVPTMGNLHEGHLGLIKKAKEVADKVVISIFVNPLQFSPQEDFDKYPRTLEQDLQKCAPLGVDVVFSPEISEMYSNRQEQTEVRVPKISDEFCGIFRPHFFYGVTTVVCKLFNIVQPDVSIFGEKDFQQLFIIKKMVKDLCFPIEILSLPTVREQDGLAMSSRNQYLLAEERRASVEIYKTLCKLRDDLKNINVEVNHIEKAKEHLTLHGFKIDYLEICQSETLQPATHSDKELIILIAAWLGKTRLIDNLTFSR